MPETYHTNDSVEDIERKLVANQAGSQVPLTGDTEQDLVRKWLLNKGGTPLHGDMPIDLLRKILTSQAGAQVNRTNDGELDLWKKIAINTATAESGSQPRTNDEKRDLLVNILTNETA